MDELDWEVWGAPPSRNVVAEAIEWNLEETRRRAAEALGYLVTDTYICDVYGVGIEDLGNAIANRKIVGFDLGFLGQWLPEWQFVPNDKNELLVSPIAHKLWEAWGPFDQKGFVMVMHRDVSYMVPKKLESYTLAELVQKEINPLKYSDIRYLFETHGIHYM